MENEIRNNKRIKLGLLLLWFVLVAGVTFTLGKYVLSSEKSITLTVNTSDYERVYGDASAPYDQKDGFGKYYIKYTGKKTNADGSQTGLTLDMQNDLVNGKLIGTELTSTYKMFEGDNTLEDILLPAGVGANAIATNTFENTTSKKRLMFKESEINTNDSSNITFSAATDACAYLYIDDAYLNGNSYQGGSKNVYISENVSNLNEKFLRGQISKARFSKVGNANWTTLVNTFNTSTLNTFPENLPTENVVDYSGLFAGCSGLTSIPEDFVIPSSATTLFMMFGGTSITEIPEHMFDDVGKGDSVNGISMFLRCAELRDVNLTLTNFNSVRSMFSKCEKLRGYITVDISIERGYADFLFEGAGTAASSDLEGFPTPIVVYYNANAEGLKTYFTTYTEQTNVYHETNYSAGKVNAIPLPKTLNDFEKVIETATPNNAPYTDSNGSKYYLRYKGSQDLEQLDLAKYVEEDGKMYWFEDNKLVPITSTYKMFEGNVSGNIEDILLPASLDPSVIATNTFKGTNEKKRLIFKKANNNLPDDYTDITFEEASDAYAYLYIDDVYLDGGEYRGASKNVYISENVSDLTRKFYGAQIAKARFSKTGIWTTVDMVFVDSTLKEWPENLPTQNITSYDSFFANCTQLTSIPENFIIPKTVTYLDSMFSGTAISSIPEHMFDEVGTENPVSAGAMFLGCKQLGEVNLTLTNMNNMSLIFSSCTNLRGQITINTTMQNANSIKNAFVGSGTNASNLEGYATPIVVFYNPDGAELQNYFTTYSNQTNVYHATDYPQGKVTAIRIPKAVSILEKVSTSAGDAPYKDASNNGYYLRYKGKTDIDLLDLANYVEDDDGVMYWLENGEYVPIKSTYKMFEGESSGAIEDIILPKDFGKNSIIANTFDGTTAMKRLIFKNKEQGDASEIEFTNADNAFTYYYLSAADLNIMNTYQGNFKNIYVSEEVTEVHSLFSQNTNVRKVRFSKVGKDSWTRVIGTFSGANNLSEWPENLPTKNVTSYETAFGSCLGITSIPDDFVIPQTATVFTYMFLYSGITAIPEHLFDEINTNDAGYSMTSMFSNCFDLQSVNISLSNVNSLNSAFYSNHKLKGTITIESYNGDAQGLESLFYDLNPTATNLDGFNTPIVVYYDSSNSVLNTYFTSDYVNQNIYHESINPTGKVTAIPLPLTVSNFKKVTTDDPNAPYVDAKGNKYYLQYKGSTSADLLDLTDYTDTDGKMYWFEGGQKVEMTSTYKMFEGNASGNIEDIILPEYMGANAIANNTFDETTAKKRLIYKNVAEGDASDIQFTNATDAATYYYLDKNTDLSVKGIYEGTLKNIYVPENIDNLDYLFKSNAFIEKVRFSKAGNVKWTSLHYTFHSSSLKYFPENIPTTNVTDYSYTFAGCSGLQSISDDFVIPSSATNLQTMFAKSSIIQIPQHMFDEVGANVPYNADYMFRDCENLADVNITMRNVNSLKYIFTNTVKLKGTITIEDYKGNPTGLQGCVVGAGENQSPLNGFAKAVVVYYDEANSYLTTYFTTYNDTTDIYDPYYNGSGNVIAKPLSEKPASLSYDEVQKNRPVVVEDQLSVKVHVIEPTVNSKNEIAESQKNEAVPAEDKDGKKTTNEMTVADKPKKEN